MMEYRKTVTAGEFSTHIAVSGPPRIVEKVLEHDRDMQAMLPRKRTLARSIAQSLGNALYALINGYTPEKRPQLATYRRR